MQLRRLTEMAPSIEGLRYTEAFFGPCCEPNAIQIAHRFSGRCRLRLVDWSVEERSSSR